MSRHSAVSCVTGFVRLESGLILLVKSPKRGWELPGGQVDPGESLDEALVREVKEESSVTVVIEKLIGIYSSLSGVQGEPDKLIHLFECKYIIGEPIADNEIIDAGWFHPDNALNIVVHQPNRLRIKDALANHHYYRVYKNSPFELLKTIDL